MLQPSRAPGREPGAPPPPPPPAGDATAAPDGAAPSAPPPSDPFGGMGLMLPMLLVVFGLFWFMNRSEKKRRSKLEEGLKKGDKVLTRAGFIGKLVDVGEARCRVELAPGVNVTMLKTAIEGPAEDEVKPKLESKDAKEGKDKEKDKEIKEPKGADKKKKS